MENPLKWLARRLGRRGSTLVILGIAFFVLGIRVILSPAQLGDDRFLLYLFLPQPVRAAIWLIPAVVAVATGVRRSVGKDAIGFVALCIPVMLQIASYLWSTVAFIAGYSDWGIGWASALVWIMELSLLLIVSGWPETAITAQRQEDLAKKGDDVRNS